MEEQRNQERKEEKPREIFGTEEKSEDSAGEETLSDKEQTFSFLQETIKPQKQNRGNYLMQFVRLAVCGMIAGVFACCSFFALKPWAERTFQGDTQQVNIPEDEEEEPEEPTEEVVESAAPALTADDYKVMMQNLYGVAKEAEKSVVSVHVSNEAEWMQEDVREGVSGLVAADNGKEILILTDTSVLKEAQSWSVVFCDGSEYPAALKKKDENRGLAVLGIDRTKLTSNTWSAMKTAELGNSNSVFKGDIVIALGNMFGYGEGVGYGIISSVSYNEIFPDARCKVIATDIPLTGQGSGVLVNQKGAVVGLIRSDIWSGEDFVTANALAISDLKAVMELLLNEESVPYAGIYGTMITDTISEEQSIPAGLYVTQICADSPAMNAGIQNGDILQKVNGEKVAGNVSYEKAILNCKVGETVKIQGQRRGGAGEYVEISFTMTVGSRE